MIDWPIPLFIGELYTSPNGDLWEWNGKAWVGVDVPIVGPIGPQGPIGATGATGLPGATGINGATGPIGPTGPYPFYYQDLAPTGSITPGSFWFDSDLGNLYVFVDDGNTTQWVTPTSFIGPTGPAGAAGAAGPTGSIGATGATGSIGATGLGIAFDYTRAGSGSGAQSWHTFWRHYSFGAASVVGTKAYAIMVERTVTIDAVFGRGNSSTATTMLVGIYTNVENQARPGTLIAGGTASFNWVSTGVQTISIPQVTLQPGVYWVGFSFANGNTGAVIQGFNVLTGYYMAGLNVGNGNPQLIWVEPGIYTTSMPATWNGASSSYIPATGGNIPYLAWKVIA